MAVIAMKIQTQTLTMTESVRKTILMIRYC